MMTQSTKAKFIVIQEMPVDGYISTKTSSNIDMKISFILRQLGMGFHVKGYTYIKRAIQMVMEDDEYGILVTKRLYPYIAKEYHTTNTAVERVIRNCIQCIDCDDQTKMNYLGTVKERYSNKEFIMAIAELLRYNV